jgi:hypothetical protein
MPPYNSYISRLPAEFTYDDEMQYKPFIPIGSPRNSAEKVEGILKDAPFFETDFSAPSKAWRSGKILKASKQYLGSLSEIGYNKDFQIVIDNSNGYFTVSKKLSDESFQKGDLVLATQKDKYPMFYAKEIIIDKPDPDSWAGSTATFKGILDVLAKDPSTWYDGPTDTLYNISWGGDYGNQVYVQTKGFPRASEFFYVSGHSPSCVGSGEARKVEVTFVNTYYSSDTLEVTLPDCDYLHKAEGADSVVVEYNSSSQIYTIKWRPISLQDGASFQDADAWNGSNSEGKVYGQYAIEKVTSGGSVTSVLRSVNVNFADSEGWIKITMTKADAEAQRYWAIYHWADVIGGSISDGSYLKNGTKRVYFETYQ